jgi:hypothetical protein
MPENEDSPFQPACSGDLRRLGEILLDIFRLQSGEIVKTIRVPLPTSGTHPVYRTREMRDLPYDYGDKDASTGEIVYYNAPLSDAELSAMIDNSVQLTENEKLRRAKSRQITGEIRDWLDDVDGYDDQISILGTSVVSYLALLAVESGKSINDLWYDICDVIQERIARLVPDESAEENE